MRRLSPLRWCWWMVITCAIILAGCGNTEEYSPTPPPTRPAFPTLNIYGPLGSGGAFDALKIAFTLLDLPYELRVFEGNSTAPGIQGVLDGTFDIAVLMQRPSSESGLMFRDFVRTPVAFFVNPSAGIDSLTYEQVVAIFSGEVTNWSELGGADQDIIVLLQEADDTNTKAVIETIMLDTPFADSGRVLLTDQEVLTVVNGMPGAVGFASWAGKMYYEFMSETEYVDAVELEGVHPSDFAYPLASVAGIAYLPEREEFLQPLFEWGENIMSSEQIELLLPRFGVTLVIDEPEG